jgi:hypothetical protein
MEEIDDTGQVTPEFFRFEEFSEAKFSSHDCLTLGLELCFRHFVEQFDRPTRSRLTKQYANLFKQFSNTGDPMP